MKEVLTSAFFRAVGGGIIVSASSFFTLYASADVSDRTLISVTGATFFGYLASRFGIEGYIDARRASQ